MHIKCKILLKNIPWKIIFDVQDQNTIYHTYKQTIIIFVFNDV